MMNREAFEQGYTEGLGKSLDEIAKKQETAAPAPPPQMQATQPAPTMSDVTSKPLSAPIK